MLHLSAVADHMGPFLEACTRYTAYRPTASIDASVYLHVLISYCSCFTPFDLFVTRTLTGPLIGSGCLVWLFVLKCRVNQSTILHLISHCQHPSVENCLKPINKEAVPLLVPCSSSSRSVQFYASGSGQYHGFQRWQWSPSPAWAVGTLTWYAGPSSAVWPGGCYVHWHWPRDSTHQAPCVHTGQDGRW